MKDTTLENLKTTIKSRSFFALILKEQFFCIDCCTRYWMVKDAKYCPFCGSTKLLIIQQNQQEEEGRL